MIVFLSMLRLLFLSFLLPFVISTPAWADEESDRLNSLVLAVLSIDNETVQINFLQGMASGLSGRRNVKAASSECSCKKSLAPPHTSTGRPFKRASRVSAETRSLAG